MKTNLSSEPACARGGKRKVRVLEREIARDDETRSVATRPSGKHDDRFLHPALPCPALTNPAQLLSPRYPTNYWNPLPTELFLRPLHHPIRFYPADQFLK